MRFGRHTILPQQQIAEPHERRRHGTDIRVLMNDYRIANATVYRYLEGVSPAQPEEFPKFVEYTFLGGYAKTLMMQHIHRHVSAAKADG